MSRRLARGDPDLLARSDLVSGPDLEVREDALDDIGIIDECNDVHGGAPVGVLEWIDRL